MVQIFYPKVSDLFLFSPRSHAPKGRGIGILKVRYYVLNLDGYPPLQRSLI